jgi:hypothetical protein
MSSKIDPYPRPPTMSRSNDWERREHDYDSFNKPDDFILAIVEFLDGDSHRVHYIRQPFQREPDFGVTSVNYDLAALLAQSEEPS